MIPGNEGENENLRKHLWEVVRAAGRMRDNYSEGDDAVKKDLWKKLHTASDEAREFLEKLREHPPTFYQTPLN